MSIRDCLKWSKCVSCHEHVGMKTTGHQHTLVSLPEAEQVLAGLPPSSLQSQPSEEASHLQEDVWPGSSQKAPREPRGVRVHISKQTDTCRLTLTHGPPFGTKMPPRLCFTKKDEHERKLAKQGRVPGCSFVGEQEVFLCRLFPFLHTETRTSLPLLRALHLDKHLSGATQESQFTAQLIKFQLSFVTLHT